MNATTWLAVGVIAVSGVCDTVTHVGFKKAADGADVDVTGVWSALRYVWAFARSPATWLSIAFSVLSLLLFLYALTMSDLSFAFSVDSVHHVFIGVASYYYLKEKITWQRWLGIGIIMVGILLVTVSGPT